MFKGKKGNAAAWIIIVIIIIILIGWWYSVANRECTTDRECGEEMYCGADYACHQIPVIEKTIVNHDYTKAAFILGIFIVIAALINKWKPTYGKKIGSWFKR
tara:strand:+ start:300 stop:605 length:306 start_codon:yes stop_codon:yes gene_type:complete